MLLNLAVTEETKLNLNFQKAPRMVIVEQATEKGTLKRNPTMYDLILYKQNYSYIDGKENMGINMS